VQWLFEHPVIGIPVVAVLVIGVVYGWKSGVQLEFDVGQIEQHHVVYRFNQMWGGLQITVDGVPVVNTVRTYSLSLTNRYEFEVGKNEIHHVRIEKLRRQLFAGFLPQVVTAYVDGVKVAEGATTRG
jgi:hypothetical protein